MIQDNILEEGNSEEIIPKIDYKKWLDKSKGGTSTKFKDMPSDSSFRRQLGRVIKNLPENDPLKKTLIDNKQDLSMDYIRDHAKTIAKSIDPKKIDEEDRSYLSIFAAIQLWGGNGGRWPFSTDADTTYEPGIPMFRTPKYWMPTYKKAVKLVQDKKYVEAVRLLNTIKSIKTPFTTKHVWFWSEYFKGEDDTHEVQPIYDNQIANLLYGTGARAAGVKKAQEVYKNIIRDNNLEGWKIHDVEQALFSFISAYYNNGITKLRKPVEDLKNDTRVPKDSKGNMLDFDEANRILQVRSSEKYAKVKIAPIEDDETVSSNDGNKRITGKQIKTAKIDVKSKDLDVLKKRGAFLAVMGFINSENLDDLKAPDNVIETLKDIKQSYDELIKDSENDKEEEPTVTESWNKWSKWATN